MPFSTNDLINTVSLDLNITEPGDPPSPEDAELIETRAKSLVADLQGRGKVYLPNLDSIPDQVFEPLVAVIILRLGPGYGRPAASDQTIMIAEDRLKAASRPTAAQRLLQTDPVLRQGNRRPGRFNGVMGS
jgi:hypothetical protein